MNEIFASSYFKTGGNTIANLVGITPDQDGAIYNAVSYYNEWEVEAGVPMEGGVFEFQKTRLKSEHNGTTIISPTVPWNGKASTIGAFQSGTGETDFFGRGCWVAIDVTAQVAPAGTGITIGAARKFGHQSLGNTNSTAGSFGGAFQIKMQAEAPFRRIKVLIHNRNTTYPVGPWIVSAAATENIGNDTDAEFSQPIVNGVTYTALATNLATQYGYRKATFGGVEQSPLVPPGTFSPEYRTRLAIAKPSAGTYSSFFNCVGTIESDWIDVESVPATDGGRPWALIRLQMLDTAANPYGGRYAGTYNVQPNTDTSINVRALPYFRDFRATTQNPTAGQDFINDPSLVMTRPTDLQAWATGNFTILFDYAVPTRNVIMIGDSVTEAYLWGELAFSQLSTVERPINFVNCGESARQTFQFNQMLEAYVESGVIFTDVVMPVFSVNDFNPVSSFDAYEAERVIYRLLERINYANSLGCKVWLWTSYNVRPGYSYVTKAAELNIINNYFRAYAEANPDTCGLFDFEANFIDGAGPTFYTKDGTHPNNNGILLGMVPVVMEAWK